MSTMGVGGVGELIAIKKRETIINLRADIYIPYPGSGTQKHALTTIIRWQRPSEAHFSRVNVCINAYQLHNGIYSRHDITSVHRTYLLYLPYQFYGYGYTKRIYVEEEDNNNNKKYVYAFMCTQLPV